MRISQLFGNTLREAPAEAEIASHQLLARAGFIRQLAAGLFSYLPLARRSLTKIENIIREEMNAIGGQEMTMPVVHPADIWKETQRWYQIGSEMGRFKDKNGRDMVLAMTHEEVVADLVRKEIRSYRQLPRLVYHIQTKWRDDPRPRAGLIRVREFTMKDSYSLDADWEGLDKQYRLHYQAYFNIFHRCGLSVVAVKSDVGMMGGKLAHEYMYLTPIGEDTLLLCDKCGYSANRQIAIFRKPSAEKETLLPVEKVPTPNTTTIDDLAALLGVPKSKTAKAVFMIAALPEGETTRDQFVFAVVRGDMEVNETKLTNALKAKELRPATEAEIKAVGAVPGYASPVGLKGCLVVVDDAVVESPNLVAGANQEGMHMRNVNYGRDYQADLVTDIAAAQEGDACPKCGGLLRSVRGVEVGNIFKLGTRYSDAMGCTFLDRDGQEKPVIMGSYGIGSGRLLACVAEEHHDGSGLVWPISIAPYQVHLVALSGKEGDQVARMADEVYALLNEAGVEVLYDDREESPGVKFNDADLIGLPIRLTVSERAMRQGGVEFKRRDQQEKRIIPEAELLAEVKKEIATLEAFIRARVVAVPFDE
ncbi:MAG: proline--tRNA ligase [Anaerolineales bacterium]|nr:proline--tRNA ligase [Anaerolineales bacterium]